MGENLVVWGASLGQIRFYYVFVMISLIYLLIKYRNSPFSLFIILMFYQGFFSFLSKDIHNIYRIALTFISLFYLFHTQSIVPTKRTKYVYLSFTIFTIVFFLTSIINHDYFNIVFSQYSRYFILFAIFLILNKYQQDEKLKQKLFALIYLLLGIQIFLSVIKFFIMGPTESIVGSIGSQGGALATSLPILGFMFLWILRKGYFDIKDWIFVLSLMVISFVSLKRAIWFVMPIVILLFVFYIPRRKVTIKIGLIALIAIPLIFYFGVRLNPTLNEEGKIGGRFDSQYALDYAKIYMFGDDQNIQKGTGRGGATYLLIDKFFKEDKSINDWFGYGLRFIYATNYEEFEELNFGLNSKGAATGVFQNYVAGGFLGIFATILFSLSMLLNIKGKRIKYVVIGFFLWEYFFYTGIILREYSLSFILIFLIVFSTGDIIPFGNKIRYQKSYA